MQQHAPRQTAEPTAAPSPGRQPGRPQGGGNGFRAAMKDCKLR